MITTLVTGMQALWQRHEILANNLANASTAGFKADGVRVLAGAAGPTLHPWTDYAPGPVEPTGRDLDVALAGDGFLVVQTPAGLRYTRAGALQVDARGGLLTAGGHRVLGERGPVDVRSGAARITEEGTVLDGGRPVDTLRVVDFPRPYRLRKEGDGLLAPAGPQVEPRPVAARLVPGALERSNVNPVRAAVEMLAVLRQYEAGQRALQAQDEADRYAANEMGRLA
jgi:flagellar basal-body rod protein FlgG